MADGDLTIAVDPPVLAGAGGAVGQVGGEMASAIGVLESALSGCGAMAGHDPVGVVFGHGYERTAQNVLNAVDAAVNACRNVGFGVAMSAANYSRAEAASTIGGGEALAVPVEPARFHAPRVPSPFGSGVAPPALWTVVEMFVGQPWPDGNPAQLRAAARAWQAFGGAITGAGGQLGGPAATIAGQRMPERPLMSSALKHLGGDICKLAGECAKVALQLGEFADDVQHAQDAIRDLLHKLGTPQGWWGEALAAVFKGDLSEVKKVADDIKTVLHKLHQEAAARGEAIQLAMGELDSAVVFHVTQAVDPIAH